MINMKIASWMSKEFMFLKKVLVILIIFLSVVTGIGFCDSQGTSGAQFLNIVTSPRAAALGSAFTAFCDDVNSIEFNPGGLAFLEKKEVSLVQNNWIQGVSNQYLAFALPTSAGTFGLSLIMVNEGDMTRRDNTGLQTGTFNASDMAASLAYARSFFDGRLSAGLNIKSINQKIDDVSASGIAGDFGVIYKAAENLNLGASVLNVGNGIQFINEADPLPTTVRVGAMCMLVKNLKIGLDAGMPNDSDATYGVGAEYTINTGSAFIFPVRAGYRTGTETGDLSGLSAGCSVVYNKTLSIDFAWVPMGILGDSMQFGISYKF
jgi:hypothetical protein